MAIAIIGAGMAGLSCAERLTAKGHTVRLFDKGRGPGGRMSTRRAETNLGQLKWDHGTQYFTARSDTFRDRLIALEGQGAVAPWTGRCVTMDGSGDLTPLNEAETRFVGTPGMNGIIRTMADPLDVCWGTRLALIDGEPGDWTLEFEDGSHDGPYETVIFAIPAEQVPPLTRKIAPALAHEAEGARSDPNWTVMLAFDQPVDAPFDGAKITEGPLGWIARNSSKPGRDAAETWLVQASADWSAAHLEDDAEDVGAALTEAFQTITQAPEPIYRAAHRWRYAFIAAPADAPFYWNGSTRIGACGDWRIGPRVELAWESGQALADELTGT